MTGNNSWTATTTNQLMLYDYILDKHKNDCVPIIKNIDGKESILKIVLRDIQNKKKVDVKFAWNHSGVKYQESSPEEIELVIKKIRQCKKRFVPLPISFFNNKMGHQNMIIIDLQKNTAEHIEPHGNIFSGGKGWDGLPEFINKKLPELFESWGLKYIPPNETCPYVSGVQSIDPEAQRKGVSKISRIVELDGVNALTGNQGGLCSLWSFILLDLRLSNPTFTIQEIMKEVLEEKSIDEFKSNVLTDFDKETINSFPEELRKLKLLKLFMDYKDGKNIKLSDIFFMYAITFAHEAFAKYTPILVKEILKEADNNKMDNFKDYLISSKVNPFKLMWIFDNTKNLKIKLSYLDENNKKKMLNNPNGIYKYAFYANVEKRMSEIVFNNLLNKSSIRVLTENPEPKPEPKKKEPKPEPKKKVEPKKLEDINGLRIVGEFELKKYKEFMKDFKKGKNKFDTKMNGETYKKKYEDLERFTNDYVKKVNKYNTKENLENELLEEGIRGIRNLYNSLERLRFKMKKELNKVLGVNQQKLFS